jgi:hypothetical protein
MATFHVLLGRNFATIGEQMQAFSAGLFAYSQDGQVHANVVRSRKVQHAQEKSRGHIHKTIV